MLLQPKKKKHVLIRRKKTPESLKIAGGGGGGWMDQIQAFHTGHLSLESTVMWKVGPSDTLGQKNKYEKVQFL